MSKPKIIVILGPTASGKTGLSIKLAKKFKGEVVSADSRQVYKGMNIGTGKVTKKEMQGIHHYLLDVENPKNIFNVSQYKKLGEKAIDKILNKNKLPFIVGGTGFYIQALVDNINIPQIGPDWKLRAKLEKKSLPELYEMLLKKDPVRAQNIDKNNPRRLIRALEIVLKSKAVIPPLSPQNPKYQALFLGVKRTPKDLNKLIEKRLLERLETGMVNEIKKLHKNGLTWARLESFGLEYRHIALYLQNRVSYDQMIQLLQKAIEHYAKRQMTWFKKDKRIKWVNPHTKEGFEKTLKLCEKFIASK